MSLLTVHCFSTIQERFNAQDEMSSPGKAGRPPRPPELRRPIAMDIRGSSAHPSQSDEFEELPLAEDLNGSTGLS